MNDPTIVHQHTLTTPQPTKKQDAKRRLFLYSKNTHAQHVFFMPISEIQKILEPLFLKTNPTLASFALLHSNKNKATHPNPSAKLAPIARFCDFSYILKHALPTLHNKFRAKTFLTRHKKGRLTAPPKAILLPTHPTHTLNLFKKKHKLPSALHLIYQSPSSPMTLSRLSIIHLF